MPARAASVGRVLYGYYHVPDRSHKPIDFVINPEGMELRSRKRCGSAAGPVTCTQHSARQHLIGMRCCWACCMLLGYMAFHMARRAGTV